MATLWMGDLEQYMDETFIKQAFTAMGEPTVNVKIISNRMTGTLAGYCFVELADQTAADRCLHKLNGKPLPGSNPPKKFKLNYATYGKKADVGQEYSIFVGDLSPEVDDFHLYDYFVKKYPSCRGGKVVTDTSGNSRGFGFVRFSDEAEQKKALEECQNSKGLGGKPIRISIAVPKRILRSETVQFTNQAVMAAAQVTVNEPSVECGEDGQKVDSLLRFFGYAAGVEGPELSMAFCSDQAEYVETAHNMYWYWQSVKTKPEYQSTATYNYTQYYQQYYSQWGYDPYGSYSYGYPQYSSTETPPVTSSLITEMTQLPEFQQNSIIPDETEEEPVEDPDPKLDIDEVNKQFMEQSEELYDSLMNCHWQPLDTITSEIPTAV